MEYGKEVGDTTTFAPSKLVRVHEPMSSLGLCVFVLCSLCLFLQIMAQNKTNRNKSKQVQMAFNNYFNDKIKYETRSYTVDVGRTSATLLLQMVEINTETNTEKCLCDCIMVIVCVIAKTVKQNIKK